MENNVPSNILSKDEFINELKAVKYKFEPRDRKQLKKAGYIRTSENTFMSDTVDDSSTRGLFVADMVGRFIKTITFQIIATFNCSKDDFTREKFEKMAIPFSDAVIEVFKVSDATFPIFAPFDTNYNPNENPDKYGIKDYLVKQAFYTRCFYDENGRQLHLISKAHEIEDENVRIIMSLIMTKSKEVT